ncbi:hypothetical protein Cme02nite_34580 [Catellatospora methionotrophica]|uniref:DUF4878 domain-containing protein n=1 Tax=Catellatospora methionotrophica TaxID=121620 RepID=A0A8J3LH79_9ACTN|nr:hypothetical protein [Catellatospora methionotrophica]GIG15126.1 hypothetical protein Cme02nite_34580 [Catellatospora methionotrophica]
MSEKPPPRKMPWFAIVAVLAICLATPTYFVYSFIADRRTVQELPPPAAAYLDALIAGDRAKGYELLCEHRRDQVPLERWRADRNMEPHVTGYRVIAGRVSRPSEGPVGYSVEVELRYSDSHLEQVALPMVEEDSGWKVCTDRGY